MSHTVFRVTGKHTKLAYYGYATTGKVQETFLAGCNRNDNAKRGDARLLESNGDDVDSLVFTELDTFDEEYDAWVLRNTHRADDPMSITGPSILPIECLRKATIEQPKTVADWKLRLKQKEAATAVEAYQLGAYTFDQIRAVANKFGTQAVKDQMKALTPIEFANLYGI